MSGGGKSGGDSYWPGFVDALTNVVIAMIFVVVVLAISLTFAAQMMGKKLAEKIVKEELAKAAVSAASSPQTAPVQQGGEAPQTAAQAGSPAPASPAVPVTEAMPTLAASRLPGVTRIPVLPPPQPASAAQVQIQPQPQVDRLQLDYDRQALELDDTAKAALLKALAPVAAGAAQRQITLVATGPDPSLSDNQRAAYVRLLSVRNVLLEQGFDPSRVTLRIDTATVTPAPRVFITVD